MPLKPESSDYEPLTNPGTTEADSHEHAFRARADVRERTYWGAAGDESAPYWVRNTPPADSGSGFPSTDTESFVEDPFRRLSEPMPQIHSGEAAAPEVNVLRSDGSQNKDTREKIRHETFRAPWILKRGHGLSFAGLFLFTAFVYLRPYELLPALSFLMSGAFVIALATLLVYVPTQLALEGTLTIRPREVNLILLLTLAGLLSVPLAINPGEAWTEFTTFLKVIVMFVVMVNVMRTEGRLKALILLILGASLVLSAGAISEYQAGRLGTEGDRIRGITGGMFGNPNDLALHLATMVPLAIALLVASRGLLKKIAFGLAAILMIAAITVTFSRGGFLGLMAAAIVLAWKLGRRHRLTVALASILFIVLFLAVMPAELTGRFAATTNKGADPVAWASGEARRDLLVRSIIVSLRHPLLGIGMGNFHIMSIHEQVTHNAYTQVASEMGFSATVIYVLFILTGLKRMRFIERQVLDRKKSRGEGVLETSRQVTKPVDSANRYYYLSIGLQSSIVGYMVSSFFASVAYLWYVYYLVGFAFCLHRLYMAIQIVLEDQVVTSAFTQER